MFRKPTERRDNNGVRNNNKMSMGEDAHVGSLNFKLIDKSTLFLSSYARGNYGDGIGILSTFLCYSEGGGRCKW